MFDLSDPFGLTKLDYGKQLGMDHHWPTVGNMTALKAFLKPEVEYYPHIEWRLYRQLGWLE